MYLTIFLLPSTTIYLHTVYEENKFTKNMYIKHSIKLLKSTLATLSF